MKIFKCEFIFKIIIYHVYLINLLYIDRFFFSIPIVNLYKYTKNITKFIKNKYKA